MFKASVLTASDKGSIGERIDESGRLIMDILKQADFEIAGYEVVPDDKSTISETLIKMADDLGTDLILTTGGTGFSPRDVTPEATLAVIDRHVPGIPEAMRYESLKITPKAMLSRAVSGIRGKTLIINLPGSPKAVKECLDVVLPVLPHALQILSGQSGECARK